MKEVSLDTLSSAVPSPSQLSTPDVSSIADDDPNCSDSGRDAYTFDSTVLNSVEVCDFHSVPRSDVLDGDAAWFGGDTAAAPLLQLGSELADATPRVSFDPDARRAQIDTGAFATVTDQLDLLHGYREFSAKFPCPVKLLPATNGSDTIPLGVGYLRVPAPNIHGYLPVRAFYHPNLRTTVINEQDFLRARGGKVSDFRSERIDKFHEAGTWTYTGSSYRARSSDVVIHGVLMAGKCYTHELIPTYADAPAQIASLKLSDPDFADACERATVYAVYLDQQQKYDKLREELTQVPGEFHGIPYHDYIHRHTPVHSLRERTERMLWHQRLGHPSDHYLYNAHKFVKGVPQFHHEHPVLDVCPTCIQAKQTKAPPSGDTTMTATQPYQGLSIDFSFSGTRSKDDERRKDYVGINGATSAICVLDHFTRKLDGDARISKASPIEWLRHYLQTHAPSCPNKYVFMDQGGELYRNPKVRQLFEIFGYKVNPTGADNSRQNAVERHHLTVENGVRALLIGANLDIKFWPYAFKHYLRIKNAVFPGRHMNTSPIEAADGSPDDFTHFRTFGCRVWVRDSKRRPAKFRTNSKKGIFLGYMPGTTKNIIWYDEETHKIKMATHARFDEGMNDMPQEKIPPNVQHLLRSEEGKRFPDEDAETMAAEFHLFNSPFSHTLPKTLKVQCDDATYGLRIADDELRNRAFVQSVKDNSSARKMFSTMKAANNAIKGAYIVSVDNQPVFTKADVLTALRLLRDANRKTVAFEFAPERRLYARAKAKVLDEHSYFDPEYSHAAVAPITLAPLPDEPTGDNADWNFIDIPDGDQNTLPSISIADLRSIASVRYPDLDFSEDSIPTEVVELAINAIRSDATTPEEQALGHFTRRKLRKLDTWDEWLAGERKQLDQFHTQQLYGKPVARPPDAIVLRPHWQYHIKRDGTRRSRNCCDGSPRAAPILHGLITTYSSCVEQPIQRMFFSLAAQLNYRVYAGDAKDAYAHSPPPDIPTFVSIDDQYAEWYEWKFGQKLDRSMVLPVLHALQGHPESGRLWERHINSILFSKELNFKNTTHDKTIYTTVFRGQKVLLLRQVDDFALACPSEHIAREIYDIIGKKLMLPGETTPPFSFLGLLDDFNGVEVEQSSSLTTISCSKYIKRVLTTHGWDKGRDELPPDKDFKAVPFSPDVVPSLYKEIGPVEHTPDHAELEKKQGFSFRSLLGELMYAYVTARPDIGYHVVTLSKFAGSPAAVHYTTLKNVARYLRRTHFWGIVYRRDTPDPQLQDPTYPLVDGPPDLPEFPAATTRFQLVGLVDAAHANDLRKRRSTTGYAFLFGGGVISYRSKTQPVTATSSTEAEFLAAVASAKHAKYLRAVLHELGYSQTGPTPLYVDNVSAINMINSRIPTERSRHIDIQHFAIQDWAEANEIHMHHIPGIINIPDGLTKALGWILHSRHARRMMGHFIRAIQVLPTAPIPALFDHG